MEDNGEQMEQSSIERKRKSDSYRLPTGNDEISEDEAALTHDDPVMRMSRHHRQNIAVAALTHELPGDVPCRHVSDCYPGGHSLLPSG